MLEYLLPTSTAELREAIARSAEFNNECFTYTTAGVDNVIACFNYLQAIGSHACTVNGDSRTTFSSATLATRKLLVPTCPEVPPLPPCGKPEFPHGDTLHRS